MMVYDTLQGKNLTFHSSRQPSWLILWHSGQRTHFSTRICCPKNRAAAQLYYSACHGTQHQRLWASEKVSLWWVWVPPQATCSSDSPVPPSFSCLLSHKLTKEKLSSTSRTSKPNILDLKYEPILQWFHHYHFVYTSRHSTGSNGLTKYLVRCGMGPVVLGVAAWIHSWSECRTGPVTLLCFAWRAG